MSVFLLSELLMPNSTDKTSSTPKQPEDMEPKKESLEMICRCCTTAADISLTGKIEDNTKIMNAINAVTNLLIHDSDSYPKFICSNCLEELKIAYQFKRKCESTDLIFRKNLPLQTYADSTSYIKQDCSSILNQMQQEREEIRTDPIHPNICNESENFYDNCIAYSPLNNNLKAENSADEDDTNLLNLKEKKDLEHRVPKNMRPKDKSKQYLIKIKAIAELKQNGDKVPLKEETAEKQIEKSQTKKSKDWKCKKCDTIFDKMETLQEHIKKKYCMYQPCPECGKVVKNLRTHEKIMHLRPDQFTCDQCGKVYYSMGALTNHQYVHKSIKEFCCDLCPYKGKRKSYLVCHMRQHMGGLRYLCSKCPLRFNDSSNLKKHLLIHANKEFECSKCKKKFRTRKVMKDHYDSKHLNIRYRCSICGRDLSTRKKLLSHELRVHKREKYKISENIQKVVVNDTESFSSYVDS